MKIAFDYQVFFAQKYGGISRYYIELVNNLLDQKQQARIFSPVHKNHYLDHARPSTKTGFYKEDYRGGIKSLYKKTNRILTAGQIRSWQPDIVHQTYFDWPKKIVPSAANVTSVYDMIHELYPEIFGENNIYSRKKKSALEVCDHIICISQSTKRDLIYLFDIDEDRVSVTHLGVAFPDETMTNWQEPVTDFPYLFYVGKRGMYKNFQSLLEAYALSDRLQSDFKIVAFGGGGFSDQEKQTIRDLGLDDRNILQVFGDDALLQRYYKNAAAFVYPSIYEGFGLPPLEAMVCKCPVVSSNTSSMPEVIKQAAEFFDPSDASSICHSICNVVYSNDRQAQLIDLGTKRAKELSWANCAKETKQVYSKLL